MPAVRRPLAVAVVVLMAAGLSVVVHGRQLRGGGPGSALPGTVPGPPTTQRPGPPSAVPLRDVLVVAADWRWFCPFIANGERDVKHGADHPEIIAITDLNNAFLSTTDPETRRIAIMGLARTAGNMTEVAGRYPKLMLENDDASVRLTAADAIGLSFEDLPRDPIYGVSVMPPWIAESYAEPARHLIETRLRLETDPVVAGMLLRSLARLPLDAARVAAVDVVLAANLTGRTARVAGAVSALEILARRAPTRSLSFETLRRLQELGEGSVVQLVVDRPITDAGRAAVTELLGSLRRLALLTLHELNNDNESTLIGALYDADWQVRRLAATYLPSRDDRVATELERALHDEVFQVRIAALTSLAPRMRVTLSCAKVMEALDDANPAVAMNALDVAPSNCSEREQLLMWMRQRAGVLATSSNAWHVPAHALMALVRWKDPSARLLNATLAAVHPAPEVRQLAATLAVRMKDESTARALASDAISNVSAAGLRALSEMESPRRGPAALAALDIANRLLTNVGWLKMTAAAALPETMPVEEVQAAMERALRPRVPGVADRAVRTSLITSYARFKIKDSQVLRELLRDADPVVAKAAAEALTGITGSPVRAEPRLLARLPGEAVVDLRIHQRFATLQLSDGGVIRIELLINDAPLTVALFSAHSRSESLGSFFDVNPGIGVRAGNSGNEVDVWSSPVKDELGEVSHARGTVAMMSNGHDLGTGQIFINLIDRPDLDHGYTVFGRIVSGLDAADRILPGVRVTRVTLSNR